VPITYLGSLILINFYFGTPLSKMTLQGTLSHREVAFCSTPFPNAASVPRRVRRSCLVRTDTSEVRVNGDIATVLGTQTEDESDRTLFTRAYAEHPSGWELLTSPRQVVA
jgi:hypothetical protein